MVAILSLLIGVVRILSREDKNLLGKLFCFPFFMV